MPLRWADEFGAPTLSLATDGAPTAGSWRTRGYESGGTLATGYRDYAGTSWNTSPAQHPALSPFAVADSVLTITCRRTPPGVTDVGGAAWMGGYLVTNHAAPTPLRWRFGYFEVRLRLPNPVRGMFPAAWLFNGVAGRSDGKEGAELDLMEVFGGRDGRPWAGGWHNKPAPGVAGNAGTFDDDTAAWHRYGVEWTPTAVRWFKDGVRRAELTGANAEWFAGADLAFRLDYVMDPSWEAPGSPLRSTADDPPPGTEPRLEVDYVRVFDAKPAPLPTGSDDPGVLPAVATSTATPTPPTPTASPSPTPVPSATATATTHATATLTVVPSPTAGPTSTSVPSPTAGPTSTSVPSPTASATARRGNPHDPHPGRGRRWADGGGLLLAAVAVAPAAVVRETRRGWLGRLAALFVALAYVVVVV